MIRQVLAEGDREKFLSEFDRQARMTIAFLSLDTKFSPNGEDFSLDMDDLANFLREQVGDPELPMEYCVRAVEVWSSTHWAVEEVQEGDSYSLH